MTVTALAVTVAALATVGVLAGVVSEHGASGAPRTGAAAAAFSTRLAGNALAQGPWLQEPRATERLCDDCATVESVRQRFLAARAGNNEHAADFWEIRVRMDDGVTFIVAAESQPSWRAGERVRLIDGAVMSM